MRREFKRVYFRNSVEDAKGDSAKLWKLLKRFIKNNEDRNKILTKHDKNSPLDIATELNNYFVNIGPRLADDIRPSGLELNFDPVDNIAEFKLHHTTAADVAKLLLEISDSKATGNDGVPIHFLKLTVNITSHILAHIIN